MKNSDLKKLILQYFETKQKMKRRDASTFRLSEQLKEIEHRFFHETGRTLKSEIKDLKEN